MSPQRTILIALVTLTLLVAAAPTVSADHGCEPDEPCHLEPTPKGIIQHVVDRATCLIYAQPPTGCL